MVSQKLIKVLLKVLIIPSGYQFKNLNKMENLKRND